MEDQIIEENPKGSIQLELKDSDQIFVKEGSTSSILEGETFIAASTTKRDVGYDFELQAIIASLKNRKQKKSFKMNM